MTAIEKWNQLAELHTRHFNDGELSVLQGAWERAFETYLGYEYHNEVRRQYRLPICTSNFPVDIAILNGDVPLYFVELKCHNKERNNQMVQQLLDYLTNSRGRTSTGILICKRLYVYNFVYGRDDDEQDYVEIEFKQNSATGIKFVELFSKGSFSETSVKRFIKFTRNVERIRQSLTSDFITGLLREYFASRYCSDEFDEAINDFNVVIESQGEFTAPPSQSIMINQSITNATNSDTRNPMLRCSSNLSDNVMPTNIEELTRCVFFIEGKRGLFAKGILHRDSEGFTVLKGSKIASSVSESFSQNCQRTLELRNRMKTEGKISNDYELLVDIPFPRLLAASEFVRGAPTSKDDYKWKTKIKRSNGVVEKLSLKQVLGESNIMV
ncbi:MAG: hypothetical protein FWH07_01140 [Oscillospiraceae bacterium]|nr:hypothetical protein [Oscillospiraceae bacterium]